MLPNRFPHSEEVLQAIWSELWFDQVGLRTSAGQPVTILDPGVQNTGNGPDFLNARLRIGGLEFAGAVEVHINVRNWYEHEHHKNPGYNQVVLHVVAQAGKVTEVYNQQGERIPTLNLLPHLSENVAGFIQQLESRNSLPCVHNATVISEEALLAQIKRAHLEYLEKKVNDFFGFFRTGVEPSMAWKYALIMALFDGFGISKNRTPMQKAATWIIQQHSLRKEIDQKEWEACISQAERSGELSWNTKGVRPAHHPARRVRQAGALAFCILEIPFEDFLGTNYFRIWQQVLNKAGVTGQYIQILYGSVFLPAVYALAVLFEYSALKSKVLLEWQSLRTPVPDVFTKKFGQISPQVKQAISKTLGTAHQIKAYCHQRRCAQCEVLKKAIAS